MYETELSNQIIELLKEKDMEELLKAFQSIVQSDLNINTGLILKVNNFINNYVRYIKIIENLINNSKGLDDKGLDDDKKKEHIEKFRNTINKSYYWINNFTTLIINLYSESESNNAFFDQRSFDNYEQ